MREILFRGQTRKKGEKVRMDGTPVESNWVYGGIFQGQNHSVIYGYDPVEKHVVYSDTIGQYTGLKDKNGKKIFEGDILAIKFFPGYVERVLWGGPPDAIATVFWDLNGFSLDANGKLDKRYADFCDINYQETEIIGNIHDNPELLEEE